MWAVGRLSLLSRGLEALRPAVAPDPKPVASSAPPASEEDLIPPAPPAVVTAPVEAPVKVAPPIEIKPRAELKAPVEAEAPLQLKAPLEVKTRHQILHESAPSSMPADVGVPQPPPPAPPSLLQRIVIRIKRFFRSLFG